MEIGLLPTINGRLADAEPDATVAPLTIIVATDPVVAVGVTVTDDVAKGTLDV
jgi:hypothetical protein